MNLNGSQPPIPMSGYSTWRLAVLPANDVNCDQAGKDWYHAGRHANSFSGRSNRCLIQAERIVAEGIDNLRSVGHELAGRVRRSILRSGLTPPTKSKKSHARAFFISGAGCGLSEPVRRDRVAVLGARRKARIGLVRSEYIARPPPASKGQGPSFDRMGCWMRHRPDSSRAPPQVRTRSRGRSICPAPHSVHSNCRAMRMAVRKGFLAQTHPARTV